LNFLRSEQSNLGFERLYNAGTHYAEYAESIDVALVILTLLKRKFSAIFALLIIKSTDHMTDTFHETCL